MKKILAAFFVSLLLPTVASAALTDNIKASWPFNESSGNAADASGNGFTATNNGSATYVTGLISNAVSGGSTGVGSMDPAGLDAYKPTTNITAGGWINQITSGGTQKFLAYSQGDVAFYVDATGHVNAQIFPCGTITSTTAISTGTWYFVVFTLVSGGTGTLYINGVSEGTPLSSCTVTWEAGSSNFKMLSNETAGQLFKGSMDDWSLWDRALSGAEITTLYNAGAGLEYPFTVATVSTPNPFILITFF